MKSVPGFKDTLNLLLSFLHYITCTNFSFVVVDDADDPQGGDDVDDNNDDNLSAHKHMENAKVVLDPDVVIHVSPISHSGFKTMVQVVVF